MSEHVGEVNLPVLTQLVSLELVSSLAYLGISGEAHIRLVLAHIWQEEWTCRIWVWRWVRLKRCSKRWNKTLEPICKVCWMSEIMESAWSWGRMKQLFKYSYPSFVWVAPLFTSLSFSFGLWSVTGLIGGCQTQTVSHRSSGVGKQFPGYLGCGVSPGIA